MASKSEETRNNALKAIIDALGKNKQAIFEANNLDLAAAENSSLPAPIISRLKFDARKLNDCTEGIKNMIALDDPLFKELLKRELVKI